MKFNTQLAQELYQDMFGSKINVDGLAIARAATDEEFDRWINGSQEFEDIPLSSGVLDCIDSAR